MNPRAAPPLPAEGYVRLADIIGRRDKGGRVIQLGVLPISKSSWVRGVRAGTYPAPVRHGGVSLYRVADIRALLEDIESKAMAKQEADEPAVVPARETDQ